MTIEKVLEAAKAEVDAKFHGASKKQDSLTSSRRRPKKVLLLVMLD